MIGPWFYLLLSVALPTQAPDGAHDFDFEIGTWKTELRRLRHPLSGDTVWVRYEGTSVIRKVWNGKANLVELDVTGPAGHIEGLSLRLYNPQARQWSLNFANSASGTMSVPTVGEFKNGRGEFYDQEAFNGRMILIRNVFSDITPNSYRSSNPFRTMGATRGKRTGSPSTRASRSPDARRARRGRVVGMTQAFLEGGMSH